ncbi:MAG: lytic transglycosylase domain-containing protein [Acidobacteriota bacterium]
MTAPSRRFLILGLALALCAPPARAALVLLVNGDVMKVAAFDAEGDQARLTLPSGGALSLPMVEVDRVLDDEVVAAPAPPPSAPSFDLGFAPAAGPPATPWGGLIYWAARKHAVSQHLVAAIVRAESDFDARALSRKGACGLMQIMPSTGDRYGLTRWQLFDPKLNLDAGARYLAWLIARYSGDLGKVLAAYNAGEGTVDRYGGVPPYRETRDYIRSIYAELGLPPVARPAAAGR